VLVLGCGLYLLGILVTGSGIHRKFFFFGGGVTPGIFFFGGGGSTNSGEDRGQREWGSGGSSPLVRGSTQFANV
jgi:hypothetical protein